MKEKIEREHSQSWYDSMFNCSLWLNALVSALTRPVILQLLALTSSPRIIKALVQFVRELISLLQLMILKQYQHMAPERPQEGPNLFS